nr:MAG TPA: hypothetical protein [Caudoviricetes sp.]
MDYSFLLPPLLPLFLLSTKKYTITAVNIVINSDGVTTRKIANIANVTVRINAIMPRILRILSTHFFKVSPPFNSIHLL